MIKKQLFKELDVNVLNLKNVLEEVRRKELTGFLRITYWTKDDFLLFLNGTPFKAVSLHSDGRRIVLDPESFKVENKEGTATLVETTLDDLVAFQEYRNNPAKDYSLIFFPYGTPVQEPVSVNFVDLNREFLLAQRSHLDGYMALYTEEKLLGMVVFQEGTSVAVFGGDASYGSQGIEFINSNLIPTKSYMSMYTLEQEILSFLYSMHADNVRRSETNFLNYNEAKAYVEKDKRNAVVLLEGGGIYRYDFFFRGQKLDTLIKEKGFFVQEEEEKKKLSVKVENMPDMKVEVFEFSLIERPSPIEVVIEGTSEEEVAVEGELPLDKVGEVKSAFIRELGPVGKLLWERTLEDFGFKESSMGMKQMKVLINKLVKEIPEEEARRAFLSKVRELFPDIT